MALGAVRCLCAAESTAAHTAPWPLRIGLLLQLACYFVASSSDIGGSKRIVLRELGALGKSSRRSILLFARQPHTKDLSGGLSQPPDQ